MSTTVATDAKGGHGAPDGIISSVTTNSSTTIPAGDEKSGNGAPAHELSKSSSSSMTAGEGDGGPRSIWRRVVDVVTYTPKRLRYDPSKPLRYSLALNLLFGLAGMATVANLYYTHPILNILAEEFGVSDERSSNIPALAQAGYCAGLLFINPMADFVKRRPFCICLMIFTSLVWIGLCTTAKFEVFAALTFVTSMTTVTPQVMLPLVADLAPVERRATAVSIVTSGLLLGLLFARLMSGVVTNFISWRYVYWIAFGLQSFFTVVLWFFMPDYPRTNKRFNYFSTLKSIFTILIRSPLLVQCSIMAFFTAACFTSFWTTLTFLLAAPPYNYTPLVIGLFALIGIVTMAGGPPFSRYVIDKYVPTVGAISGTFIGLISIIVGTYTGTFTVAGPVIQAIGVDLGFQISQIANRAAIYGIDPKARNRVNTAYMVILFCGQLTGTAVGNNLFAQGGWHRSGAASIAFMAAAFAMSFVRGPRETGWVGWRGGWNLRRRDLQPQKQDEETVVANGDESEQDEKEKEKEKVGEASSANKASGEEPRRSGSASQASSVKSTTKKERSKESLERLNAVALARGAPPQTHRN